MADALFLPIRDVQEVHALLDELPLTLDRKHFAGFVLGFPRHYLLKTPRVEIVKHFLLAENLGQKNVITSLAKEGEGWTLLVIATDRSRLFSRIAGALSCYGANISSAEAFANASAMVLDTFRFVDQEKRFERDQEADRFQHFLEDVIEGTEQIEPHLRDRWPQLAFREAHPFDVEISGDAHPEATRISLRCGDHFGLLYLLSHTIAGEGCGIESAFIQTVDQTVQDEFYVTKDGRKLTPAEQEDLRRKLEDLGRMVLDQPEEAGRLI